jgi:hypothetical protein
MTWSGKQGFQTPIVDETYHVQDFGVYGNMHQERGLTCASFLSSITRFPCPAPCFISSPLSCASSRSPLIRDRTDVEFYLSGHMTPREYFWADSADSGLLTLLRRVRPVGGVPHDRVSPWSPRVAFGVSRSGRLMC